MLIALAALAAPIAARAESPPQPIPADGKCAVPVDPNWTKQEQFVWLNVCVGNDADFNKAPGYGGDLDPKSPTGLPDNRILRSSFLETILLKNSYRSALTRLGVRITGARFTESVDLQNAELEHDFWLDRSLLEKGANLFGAQTSHRIRFDGSRILGTFNAVESKLDKDLSLYQTEFNGGINLSGAHIGGQLLLSGSTVTGMLNMDQIHVDQALFMRDRANFTEINLAEAHIGGQLDMRSSTITGMLDMNQIQVEQALLMSGRANFKEIDLTVAHIGGRLDLSSSTVTDTLYMDAIRVDQDLLMRNNAQFEEIFLAGAHIGGRLDLSSSTVTDILYMKAIRVDQDLLMRDRARFKMIDLVAAHIGGQLDLSNSTVTGRLYMNVIRADQNLLMRDKAKFREIFLAGAHIGGMLDLGGSTVTGKLEADYIDVAQTMYLGTGATFADEIDLTFAKVGQDLSLSGGIFYKTVDLAGARFNSILGLDSAHWLENATLDLTNAAADRIDLSDRWPDKTSANEFTYRNLSNMSQNISKQAENWFGKQAYAPQPYEQLASFLQSNGLIEDAIAIRYAGKEQERKKTPWGLHWFWLVLLNYSIGFGFHLEFAFYWAVGFVLLGWAVLYATGQRTKYGTTLGLTYSFDMLLPLVQLNKKHYDIDLDPWPQRYFYAHKIIGVVLTSFIVAGISGLTK